MKNIVRILCMGMILIIVTTIFGCANNQATQNNSAQKETMELNISAAVSLKDALDEIAKKYQADHPNVKLIYNLGASGSLQKQIEQGAPVDIFISAAFKQMNDLETKNLIKKDTRKNLVENQLVVITPKESKIKIARYEDLTQAAVQKVALGETGSVPAGQYAQEVLNHLNIWEQLEAKAVFAKDVRTVLAYVETGNVDAGIVYKTDAAISDKVQIQAVAPKGTHQPIIYPAAIVSTAKQLNEAEKFLAYLSGLEAAKVFEKYGYRSLIDK